MRSFTDAEDAMDAHSFPADCDDLIAEYGDMILDLPNGSEPLGDALSVFSGMTFTDAEEARLAMYSGVSDKAIGRKYYSDRDGFAPGEDGPDAVSF